MKLIEYPDEDLMMMHLADTLASELEGALLTHARVSFACAGGTTPGPVYDTLSAVHLDWERVHVLPTDERCVPSDHPRSNARLLGERLLTGAAAGANLVPLYTDGTPEEAAAMHSTAVAELAPLSILLLGMGGDMHTASLFPGADGLAAALDPHAPALVPVRPADQPEARLSLSGPILSGALCTHLLITGTQKREALERARTLSPQEAPVRLILDTATIHWSE